MTDFSWVGVLLGLSSGLAPGPLLTLVVSETLRHGTRAGIAVALAPLLSDAPIILATLVLVHALTDQHLPLALLGLAGGCYLAWLGLQSVRFQGADLTLGRPAASLLRGVIANLLNPSPYLFWLTVGASQVLAAWRQGWPAAAGFLVAFYGCLAGSKVLMALLLGRTRHLLRSRSYILLMRSLGAVLLLYAGWFLYQAGTHLIAWRGS